MMQNPSDTTTVALRPLVAHDQAFLWEALYLALWDPPGQPRRARSVLQDPRVAAYVQDWGRQPDDVGFVAMDRQGAPVGVVWSRLLLPPLAGGAFLDEKTPQLGIAVVEAAQGRGIGRALMSAYLRAAADRFPAVSLGVHPANHRAIALYQQFQFVQYATGGGGYLNMVRRFGV